MGVPFQGGPQPGAPSNQPPSPAHSGHAPQGHPGHAPQGHPGHAPQSHPGHAPQGHPGHAPQGHPGYAPNPAYAHPGAAPYAGQQGYHPGAHRSGKGKWIILGVVLAALAAGGIVLAVVLNKSDDSAGFAGAETPETLTEQVVTAMASGDGERVVSMMPSFELYERFMKCPPEVGQKHREKHDKERAEIKALVAGWKGHELELTSHKVGEPIRTEAGPTPDGCEALVPYEVHPVELALAYKVDGAAKNWQSSLFAIKFDEAHYLGFVGEMPPEVTAKVEQVVAAGDEVNVQDAGVTDNDGGIFDQAIADFAALETTACACQDNDCRSKAKEQLDALLAKYKDVKPSDEQMKIAMPTVEAAVECTKPVGAKAKTEESSAAASSLVEEMNALRDEACACKDMQCFQPIAKKMEALAPKFPGLTNEDLTKIGKISQELSACVQKLAEASMAGSDAAAKKAAADADKAAAEAERKEAERRAAEEKRKAEEKKAADALKDELE